MKNIFKIMTITVLCTQVSGCFLSQSSPYISDHRVHDPDFYKQLPKVTNKKKTGGVSTVGETPQYTVIAGENLEEENSLEQSQRIEYTPAEEQFNQIEADTVVAGSANNDGGYNIQVGDQNSVVILGE